MKRNIIFVHHHYDIVVVTMSNHHADVNQEVDEVGVDCGLQGPVDLWTTGPTKTFPKFVSG